MEPHRSKNAKVRVRVWWLPSGAWNPGGRVPESSLWCQSSAGPLTPWWMRVLWVVFDLMGRVSGSMQQGEVAVALRR